MSAPPPPGPADGRPADGRPADGRPADGRPADGRPADGRPADGRPADGRPARARVAPLLAGARRRLASVEIPLRDALRDALRARVAALLAPRTTLLATARAEADALLAAVRAAEPRAAAAIARLDRSPFSAGMTVHAAHARHPGVQAVFARHGLPRCPDCAVGADETLAEAAAGESFPLEALLAELDALLVGPAAPR